MSRAVSEMDQVTQRDTTNAEETASASREMNAQAEEIRAFVKEMTGLVVRRGKSRAHAEAGARQRIVKIKVSGGACPAGRNGTAATVRPALPGGGDCGWRKAGFDGTETTF